MRAESQVKQFEQRAGAARVLNLFLPGGGLILLDSVLTGLVLGMTFTSALAAAILATLLIPAEFAAWMTNLLIAASAISYLVPQLRLAQVVRVSREKFVSDIRRRALESATKALQESRYDDARAALAPIVWMAERDLLVAYRLAQIAAAQQDLPTADVAWAHVRRLDAHRLYAEALAAHEAQRRADSPGVAEMPGASLRRVD